MKIVKLQKENKEEVEQIVANSYSGLQIAVHRELYDLRELPCVIAVEVTYFVALFSKNRVI